MKNETNIKKLAELGRIYISEKEEVALRDDIDLIISYIEQIKDISTDTSITDFNVENLHNVMRADGEPHETGIYTKELLNEAPLVKDNYIEVKKIIGQDK